MASFAAVSEREQCCEWVVSCCAKFKEGDDEKVDSGKVAIGAVYYKMVGGARCGWLIIVYSGREFCVMKKFAEEI